VLEILCVCEIILKNPGVYENGMMFDLIFSLTFCILCNKLVYKTV